MPLALGVVFLLRLVNASIQLNNQRVLVTIKIRKIAKDDLLPAKVQPIQFIRPKMHPQNLLCMSHLAPQLLRKLTLLVRNPLPNHNILYNHAPPSPPFLAGKGTGDRSDSPSL